MKKIVIFGSTGQTGLCATEAAVKKGYQVRAFVRDPKKVPEHLKDKVEIFEGNTLEIDSVMYAVEGMDGVVIAVGTRNSLEPTSDMSEGTRNILEAMRAKNVRKVSACLSAFLFYEPDKVPPRFVDLNEDHQRMYELIKESGLDWVAVFPPHIADEPSRDIIVEINPDKSPGRSISKWDLGSFLVDSLSESKYYKTVVGIANKSIRTNEYGQPIGDALPSWTPPPRPSRVKIPGRHCSLLPFSVAHAKALHQAFSQAPDGRYWTYMLTGPYTEEGYMEFAQEMEKSEDPLFFTIVDNSGRFLGTMSLLRIDERNGVIEVGHIMFSPLLQRSRISTEAQYLMMKYIFELGYRRYEWKCDSLNAPSRRAAKRLGFSFDGIFRQSVVYKGRSRDTAWFSVVDGDWPKNKEAFELWLDDKNFDADGKQIMSLEACRETLHAVRL